MKCCWTILILVGALGFGFNTHGDEVLPTLKVGDDVYTNVTVTSVTPTDLYFSHAHGMGNVKLKTLSPELQKHFNFDPLKASMVETNQIKSAVQYRHDLVAREIAAAAQASSGTVTTVTNDDGDLVVTKLFAKSFLGERPPQVFVDAWLTPPPEVNGKFVLVFFWESWAEQCLKAIPHLNDLQSKFKGRLAIIGLSNEAVSDLQKEITPRPEFPIGTDTQARTRTALEVLALPHSILVDPKGLVRYEGLPDLLDAKALTNLITKYSD